MLGIVHIINGFDDETYSPVVVQNIIYKNYNKFIRNSPMLSIVKLHIFRSLKETYSLSRFNITCRECKKISLNSLLRFPASIVVSKNQVIVNVCTNVDEWIIDNAYIEKLDCNHVSGAILSIKEIETKAEKKYTYCTYCNKEFLLTSLATHNASQTHIKNTMNNSS